MSVTNLSTLMSQLGFGTGFRLPVANEENQKLEKLLEEKQQELLEFRMQIEDEKKQREHLREHIGRTSTQINFSGKMIESANVSLDADQNMQLRFQTTQDNLKSEIEKTKMKYKNLKIQNTLNIEQLEKRKDWCEKKREQETKCKMAVDNLRDAIKDKEKDMDYVLNLMNIDSKLVHECEHKYLKLGEELEASKQTLNKTIQVTHGLEFQYSRAISQFQQIHKERNQAVDMWKRTLTNLKNRDDGLKDVTKKYRILHKKINNTNNKMDKKLLLFDIAKANTIQVNANIYRVNQHIDNIRIKIEEDKEHNKTISIDLIEMKNSIKLSTNSMKILTDKMNGIEKEMDTMELRTNKVINEIKIMKNKIDNDKNGDTSSYQKLKTMEKLVDEEENNLIKLKKDLVYVRSLRWTRGREILDLKEKLIDLEFKIKSEKYLFKTEKQQAKETTQNIQQNLHTLYELQLDLINVKRRYDEMTESKIVDIYFTEVTNTLNHSRIELNDIIKEEALLIKQNNHSGECNRRIRLEHEKQRQRKIEMRGDVELMRAEDKTTLKLLQLYTNTLIETRVEHSMVQLTQRRLEKMDKEQKETNVTIEKNQLQLLTALKQRRSEVDMHLSLLKVNLRLAREAKSKVTTEKNQILADIQKRKNNYESLISTMTSAEEREKSEFTEANFILKHVQEKELIKKEGDKWDSRVKEAEKETTALQNTLAVMKNSNNAFKESLTPALVGTEELEQIKMLEHKLLEFNIRKKNIKKNLRDVIKKYYEKEEESKQLSVKIDTLNGIMSDKNYQLNSLMIEIKKQKEKIDRAIKVGLKIQKSFKNQGPNEKKIIEEELKLKFSHNKFSYALKMLDRAILTYPELKIPTLNYLNQKPKLNHVAKHLEKSGKCISIDGSQPSTPKSSKMKLLATDSTDADLIRKQHRALQDIPSVLEMRTAVNSNLVAMKPGERIILHNELVSKFGIYSDELKKITSKESVEEGLEDVSELVGVSELEGVSELVDVSELVEVEPEPTENIKLNGSRTGTPNLSQTSVLSSAASSTKSTGSINTVGKKMKRQSSGSGGGSSVRGGTSVKR